MTGDQLKNLRCLLIEGSRAKRGHCRQRDRIGTIGLHRQVNTRGDGRAWTVADQRGQIARHCLVGSGLQVTALGDTRIVKSGGVKHHGPGLQQHYSKISLGARAPVGEFEIVANGR